MLSSTLRPRSGLAGVAESCLQDHTNSVVKNKSFLCSLYALKVINLSPFDISGKIWAFFLQYNRVYNLKVYGAKMTGLGAIIYSSRHFKAALE